MGSFSPFSHHFLNVPCVHTTFLQICKRMRQAIGGVEGMWVHMGLYLVHFNSCTDSNEVAERLVVQWCCNERGKMSADPQSGGNPLALCYRLR